jgi:hypothetical protein
MQGIDGLPEAHHKAAVAALAAEFTEVVVSAREERWKDVLQRLADCVEPSLFEELKDMMIGRGAVGRRICPTARERERCAKIAESWGHAPPNPDGRRAALAAAIRSGEPA